MLQLVMGIVFLSFTGVIAIILRQLDGIIRPLDSEGSPRGRLLAMENKLIHYFFSPLAEEVMARSGLSRTTSQRIKDRYHSRLAQIESSRFWARLHADALVTARLSLTLAAISLVPGGAILVFAETPDLTAQVGLLTLPVFAGFIAISIHAGYLLWKSRRHYVGTTDALEARLRIGGGP